MGSHPLIQTRVARAIAVPSSSSIVWPALGVTAMLCVHLSIMFGRSINWDEFLVYSQIHQLARGELTLPLQTFQTRLFEWILLLDVSNIDQIIAARGVMFGCVLVVASSIVVLAERFTGRAIALTCALSWLSMGFVVQHATSLRTDAMAAALLMTSLVLIHRSRLGIGALLLTATLAAMSALITMKTVLYAPAFAGIAWLRWQDAGRSRDAAWRLVALAGIVPVLFTAFYLGHSLTLPTGTDAEAVAKQSAGMMFRPFVMFFWQHMWKGALISPILTMLLAAMVVLLCRKGDRSLHERLALIGLALPLSSFLFYNNAFAYFFVFILPPVCVACLVSIEGAKRRYSLALVCVMLTLNGATMWWLDDTKLQAEQRRMVDAADMIFHQPISYFDGPAQLGQFRKENLLLDAWSFETYRYGDFKVSMEAATERATIPLVLANTGELISVFEYGDDSGELRPGDIAMLRDTYIPFWGPYYLAGEEVRAGENRLAKIRVPGPYTVVGAPLVINGTVRRVGEIVRLGRGTVRLAAGARPSRLVWGERLVKPSMLAPKKPYWVEF